MVERKIELRRRYRRKKKMLKLKKKLAEASEKSKRDKLLYKISCLSPMWEEPQSDQG